MPVITNIEMIGIAIDLKHGLVVQLQGDAPPGPARSSQVQRKQFWDAGKRLPMGGLVGLVSKDHGQTATVSLAILTTCGCLFLTHSLSN